MTPAEKLAASKPTRVHRPSPTPETAKWTCSVAARRTELRLTLDDVSKAIGVSKTTLWQLEQGSEVVLTTAMKLAEFFGCRIEDLWKQNKGKI